MFWQFENGTLLNLNVLEDIGLFYDAETGLWYVRGRRWDRAQFERGTHVEREPHIDLFSSKDEERVQRVLENIGISLGRQESLVRASLS